MTGPTYDTHALKERGWSPRMIARLLPHHDATRGNELRVGHRRRRIEAPVKLYLVSRVEEAEQTEDFLIAQAVASKGRQAAEKGQQTRQQRAQAAIRAFVDGYQLQPIPPQQLAGLDHLGAWRVHSDERMQYQLTQDQPLWDFPHQVRRQANDELYEKMRQAFAQAYPHFSQAPK